MCSARIAVEDVASDRHPVVLWAFTEPGQDVAGIPWIDVSVGVLIRGIISHDGNSSRDDGQADAGLTIVGQLEYQSSADLQTSDRIYRLTTTSVRLLAS